MLLSLALILIISITLNAIFIKIKIPGLIAFIITGIILGPFVLNLIDSSILNISGDLKEIALIVILLRAGLSLDLSDLKSIGKSAAFLSFLPSTFEIVFIGLASYLIFNISLIEGFILGSVVAAVSPAVVVPRMVHLIESKLGTNKQIPQLILAGSSIDNIYCLVMFAIFVGIYQTNTFNVTAIILFPVTIIVSLLVGILIGLGLVKIFKWAHMRDTIKVLVIFGTAFLLIVLEQLVTKYFRFSGLLAIIALGGTILETHPILAGRLTNKFSKIWVAAEIMLFVLVGSSVDISAFNQAGILAIVLILVSLSIRMIAVLISVSGSSLNKKEKIFTCIAYIPKATVQAAIGAVPLALGIPAGSLILTISVLAIFITAPIGAIGMDRLEDKLLTKTVA